MTESIYMREMRWPFGESQLKSYAHLLEIRGVGIIDVMSLYGASAVKDSSQVQIAVYLKIMLRIKFMIVLVIMQKS